MVVFFFFCLFLWCYKTCPNEQSQTFLTSIAALHSGCRKEGSSKDSRGCSQDCGEQPPHNHSPDLVTDRITSTTPSIFIQMQVVERAALTWIPRLHRLEPPPVLSMAQNGDISSSNSTKQSDNPPQKSVLFGRATPSGLLRYCRWISSTHNLRTFHCGLFRLSLRPWPPS